MKDSMISKSKIIIFYRLFLLHYFLFLHFFRKQQMSNQV